MRLNLSPALAAATIIALISTPSCHRRSSFSQSPEASADTVYPLGFCTDSFDLVEGTLRSGEIFTGLISRLGMSPSDAMALVSASAPVFDPRKLRAGNSWQAYYGADSTGSTLRYLVYDDDRTNLTVFRCTEPFSATKVTKPVAHTRKFSDVVISSSLWNDMRAAGAHPMLIVHLEDIYGWTVDFFSLRRGDRFRVIYDESSCEGEVIDIDTIYFAVFDRGGKSFPAIMLDRGDGGNRYWNEKGESMRKAFLKAPLRFSRISSGFSYHRKHPVSGKVKAHTGVDYAAPAGTPVMAIGDGTVISRGWSGGGGNTVKIRHNSIYTTAYLHLSRYASALKTGDIVKQGDVIGYVGSTGVSTGPHLDFRVWKNGSPINPLKMESPSAEPLPEAFRPALDSTYRALCAEMSGLTAASDSLRAASSRDTLRQDAAK